MPISKLEAARSQLDCAIRLFFNEDDLPSIITLSRAAFRLLYDLYPTLANDGFIAEVDALVRRHQGWGKFNEMANHLKHADRDPEASLNPHPIEAIVGIGFSTSLYRRATNTSSNEMTSFDIFLAVLMPEYVQAQLEPYIATPSFDGYRDAVEKMKRASHSEQMELGRILLTHLRTKGNWDGFEFSIWRPAN